MKQTGERTDTAKTEAPTPPPRRSFFSVSKSLPSAVGRGRVGIKRWRGEIAVARPVILLVCFDDMQGELPIFTEIAFRFLET